MPLSWNEIRSNALAFSKEWAGESREHAEAKSFWDDFFKVFGHKRRQIASFEEPVKNLEGHYSFIDLFWKGMLLAEHKSLGKDLDKAHTQAMEYVQDLQREGRGEEVPPVFGNFRFRENRPPRFRGREQHRVPARRISQER